MEPAPEVVTVEEIPGFTGCSVASNAHGDEALTLSTPIPSGSRLPGAQDHAFGRLMLVAQREPDLGEVLEQVHQGPGPLGAPNGLPDAGRGDPPPGQPRELPDGGLEELQVKHQTAPRQALLLRRLNEERPGCKTLGLVPSPCVGSGPLFVGELPPKVAHLLAEGVVSGVIPVCSAQRRQLLFEEAVGAINR
jgi:hypothetical protein